MKRHLNTVFVTLENAYLCKDGEALLVRHEHEDKLRVPLINLDGIVCLGWDIACSPQLMGACAEAGVTLSFLSPHGKFLAAVRGFTAGNVLLRREQYRRADDPAASLAIARHCVAAKIANCRLVLQRALRDHHASPPAQKPPESGSTTPATTIPCDDGSLSPQQFPALPPDAADAAAATGAAISDLPTSASPPFSAATEQANGEVAATEGAASTPNTLAAAVAYLERRLRGVAHVADLDTLRGVEGECAAAYFAQFNHLLTVADPALRLSGRTRRPPLDPVNALLSFLYALLAHDLRSACEACGLDAAVGFLHRDRPGRASLALDLMEELRPVFADRLALSLLNRRQLGAGDFERHESGAVTLKEKPRKAVLVAWQERKRDELVHPFLQEKTTLGLVPHLQARLLARHLRGDLDAYPAFLWR